MLRKLIKSTYLSIIKIVTLIFYPLKVDTNQIVYYASFVEDLKPIIAEINEKSNFKVILFYHPRIEDKISQLKIHEKYRQSNANVIKELFYIMTSRYIIVDTYYLIFGGVKKKKQQVIIQTWHASGALKKFGLEDQALKNVKLSTIEQYKKVYRSFDFILVGSDQMGEIFKRSFGIKNHQLLKFGLPRMDVYFDEEYIENCRCQTRRKLQIKDDEKMVLYVPTYREDERTLLQLPVDFSTLNKSLRPIVKLHPAVNVQFDSPLLSDFMTEDLLIASDIVITDYSSLAFEASLLGKSIYFFTYDQLKYNNEKGLIDDYDNVINNQNFNSNDELINAINQSKYHSSKKINQIWNKYNKGNASQKFVEWLIKK